MTQTSRTYEILVSCGRDELLSSSKAGDELDFALDLPITYEGAVCPMRNLLSYNQEIGLTSSIK